MIMICLYLVVQELPELNEVSTSQKALTQYRNLMKIIVNLVKRNLSSTNVSFVLLENCYSTRITSHLTSRLLESENTAVHRKTKKMIFVLLDISIFPYS